MKKVTVTELYYYPVKSCGGTQVDQGEVTQKGFRHDRHWMVTDDNGLFITQRKNPEMALVRPSVDDNLLTLSIKGNNESITVPLSDEGKRAEVEIWATKFQAIDDGDMASEFFSDHIGKKAMLVHLAPDQVREVDQDYGRLEFADSYPFLIVSSGSLNDLNKRIVKENGNTIPMNRFRPNIVLSEADPYAEDSWAEVQIGEIIFDLGEHAVRCVTTTTDQETGARGKNPLKTLATYRKVTLGRGKKGVIFGQRAVNKDTGWISVGDVVTVINTKDPYDYTKLLAW